MESIDLWTGSVTAAMTTLWSKLASFAPHLLGAILILALGYFVAKFVSALLIRLLVVLGMDRFSETSGVTGVLSNANIDISMSRVIGRIVFWILLLTFLVSATETLGLPRVSATIDSLVHYLPKVLGAALMLLTGLFAAGLVRDAVRTAADGIGFDYASALGTCVYGLLVVIVVSLAIGQLELETALLTQAVSILLFSAGAAAALAFGLGAKEVAGNVLAGSYVRDSFLVGDHVSIGDTSGEVQQVGAVNTMLITDSGFISVPNTTLMSSIARKTRAKPGGE